MGTSTIDSNPKISIVLTIELWVDFVHYELLNILLIHFRTLEVPIPEFKML